MGIREGKILVVDHDENIRLILEDDLNELSYEIYTTADGESALEIL